MPYDRDIFFVGVRANLFSGSLTQSQVNGMNYLLDVWEQGFEAANPRDGTNWLAYCLATVYHETGRKMIPVEEIGKGKGYPYGKPVGPYNNVYYGRGHVQLTWDVNYQRAQDQLKKNYGLIVPLYQYPDKMLEDQPSALVLYDGMTIGWFTGVGLPRYFNATTEDAYNARRVVNGTDQANTIKGYYEKFKSTLVKVSQPVPEPVPPPAIPTLIISSNVPINIQLGENVTVINAVVV